MSHFSTVVLYVFIILWAIIWGRIAQRKRSFGNGGVIKTKTNVPCLIVALIIPWYFLSFTNIGVDYYNYWNIINEVTWYNYGDYFSWEPFFLFISVFFKTICNGSPDTVIFVYKTITLVIIGLSMYLLRNEVRLWMSIMVYIMLFYFGSFYLIAMCLASAIVTLAIVLWHKKGLMIIPLFLIVLAAQIHNSMYLLLPLFILAVYYNKSSHNNKVKLLVIVLSFIVSGVLAMFIFNWAVNNIASFHYDNYTDVSNEGMGIMFFVRFGILFFLIYGYYKMNNELSDKFRFYIILGLASALFYNMGYTFRVIGRMDFALISFYFIFMPYLFNKTIDKIKTRNNPDGRILNFICFIFLFTIGYDEVSVRIADKISPGLGVWTFFWPF